MTGGATGIGRSVALEVTACGANAAVFDINSKSGAVTVNKAEIKEIYVIKLKIKSASKYYKIHIKH